MVLTNREIREKHGYNNVPLEVINYIYSATTASENLRSHLQKHHTDLYERMCEENKWNYKPKVTSTVVGANQKSALPAFLPEMFLKYLIRFVMADNQVYFCFTLKKCSHTGPLGPPSG